MSDVTHFGSIKDMTTRTQMVVKLLEINFFSRTRLNMLFTPTLPVKAECTVMLGMLSIDENAE